MIESDEPGPVCWQSHKELGFKYNKIFSDYEKLLAKYNELLAKYNFVFEWAESSKEDFEIYYPGRQVNE